jgi:hypothetical protein
MWFKLCSSLPQPIPVTARSKVWVCGRSLADVAGANPVEGHGCLSIVCCQVEVSATGWSLAQRSTTDWGVSECDHEATTMRDSGILGAAVQRRSSRAQGEIKLVLLAIGVYWPNQMLLISLRYFQKKYSHGQKGTSLRQYAFILWHVLKYRIKCIPVCFTAREELSITVTTSSLFRYGCKLQSGGGGVVDF